MRRSALVDQAYDERFAEELANAKQMTRAALEQAYAEKAAFLSLGGARTEAGDDSLKMLIHRRAEIAGKFAGRRSARSESARHAASQKPEPEWHAEARREADRLIAEGTAPRNVASKIARIKKFSRFTPKVIREALKKKGRLRADVPN